MSFFFRRRVLRSLGLPNTASTGQVRGFARTFGEAAQRGRFGIWWFCPLNPALAGNASRWPVLLGQSFENRGVRQP